MAKKDDTPVINNLDPKTFFFDLPLYTPIKIIEDNWDDFVNLLQFSEKIDGYNHSIKGQTTFKGYSYLVNNFQHYIKYGGLGHISIQCLRTELVYTYYIHYDLPNEIFMKVGQHPSIADIHISQIKKYDKLLTNDKLKEFTRAIGLSANGVGIGSFVYLRRIFEDLIEDAHIKASKVSGWNEEEYQQKRIVERIELLKHFLPEFLVENKSLYGILSVGIHSLTEDDCLKYFDTVRIGIELILDEKLEEANRLQKIDDAKKKLAKVASQMNKKE